MVTGCFCFEPWWVYLLRMLLEGGTELMFWLTPAAICAVVWDAFSRHNDTGQEITVLGLDASMEAYLPSANCDFPMWTVLLYLITGVLTFGLGLLVFDVMHALS